MEQIRISFDGGQTVMNFAEAALLIQGSACIYSKKVTLYLTCMGFEFSNLYFWKNVDKYDGERLLSYLVFILGQSFAC